MKAKTLLTRLFFPPRCAACHALMSPFVADTVLCRKCRISYERSLLFECDKCFLPMYYCNCVEQMMKRAGITEHIKAAAYREGERFRVPRALVLKAKRDRRRDLFSFLAGELAEGVQNALIRSDVRLEDEGKKPISTVIGFLPRSKTARHLHGFDQAEELAHALSSITSIPCVPVLTRVGGEVEQKTLDVNARRANLAHAFRAEAVRGLRILLVDDLVTSGAGMSAAARVLYRAGAAEVIAVSFARTPKER